MADQLEAPAWCGWCGDTGCEQCDPEHAYYDADYEDDFYDEPDFHCGMTGEGICMLAGSEDCDWKCPNRHKEFFGRSRLRNRADKVSRHLGNLWHLIVNIRKLRRKTCPDCGSVEWTVYGEHWLCDECVPF